MQFYAGIGSRKTPKEYLKVMQNIAIYLANKKYVLRSGHADGADIAFELGCDSVKGNKEIYIPWKNFNGADNSAIIPEFTSSLEEFSKNFHPKWNLLSLPAKKLMMRNSCQIFGLNGDTPVKFIICWHNNSGGTMQAVRIANYYQIPVINLAEHSIEESINIINLLIDN